MREINDASFDEEVLRSEIPVLVDFWATWCGPCIAMEPVLEELAEEFVNRLLILKAEVTGMPNTAVSFMIQAVPTYLFFREGRVVKQLVGAVPRARLRSAIEEVIG